MFNCPLSTEKASRLIEQLHLGEYRNRVLDIGCGEGEFLIRVAERYNVTGIGIDHNLDLTVRAEQKAQERGLSENLSFICQDAQSFAWETHKANLIICIGSEFILGGYRQALRLFSHHLTSSEAVLLGTVYWKQDPVPEYLDLMGGENPHFDYLTTVDIAIKEGFIPLYLCRSNQDEWDDFESRHSQKRYQAALKNTDEAALKHAQEWQRGYLKWGNQTMGFGFFLLQKI
ncbi:MAG: class I SAM-dependent methyltransferase [Cyanobacteria bacterium P01_H01_bin.119]